MSTRVGVGESHEINTFEAGKTAALEAMNNAGIKEADFVLVFATVAHEQQELIRGIQSITGNAPLSGCGAEGTITQNGPNEEVYGVSVMVFASTEIKFTNAFAQGLNNNSKQAGIEIGNQLNRNWPKRPIALIIIADGLTVNTAQLFQGLNQTIKEKIPFLGGISSDNWKMLPDLQWQYHNGKTYHDSVTCILLSGEATLEIGVSHGCLPLGIERTITKSQGNRIYEIDQTPCFTIFKEYADSEIQKLDPHLVVHLCLGIKLPENYETEYNEYIIRTLLTHDTKDNSMTTPAEIPEGTKFCITRREPGQIIEGIKKQAQRIKDKLGKKKPLFVLHFDCAGRGKIIFGREAKRETDAVQDLIGKNIPWIGFYSYGEIAPIKNVNYYHNYTAVIGVIY